MKATGIVRRVDELGRIVLPVELRRTLDISERDPLEIYVDGASIVLRKFRPNCIFCNSSRGVSEFRGKNVCQKCLKELQAITFWPRVPHTVKKARHPVGLLSFDKNGSCGIPQIVEEKGWYFLPACGMIKRTPSNNTGPYPLIELQIRRKPMTFLQSILLGLIQGVAEFLPISSSGHLAIAQNLLNINAEVPAFYDVLLHLGTLVAVFVAYWQDICDMVREFFCGIGDLVHHSTPTPVPPARRLILLIILGTLPLFAILPIKDTVEGLKNSMVFIGAALIVTGFLLFFSDRARKGRKDARSATVLDVLVVGVSQAIATVPGISRSGMTITTGCFVGFERRFAVRFSFLLSIPAVLGANILSLKDALAGGVDWSQLPVYLAGVVVAAVSGYLCIRLLKMIADKGRFGAFAYYCWAAGLATLILNAVK